MLRFVCGMILLLSSTLVLTLPASAQRKPSHCIAVAKSAPGLRFAGQIARLQQVAYRGGVPEDTVRLRYIAHSSYLIETHGGLTAITDFTGFVGNVEFTPDVVTMNHAHTSHWTPFPDPAIPHVLKGWGETPGEGIDHYLDLGELLIRNVSTDIRSGFSGIEKNGNSIFVFEVAGLCLGHLGHLHHEPSEEQYAALGRLDVLMVPVDGGMTLPLPDMIRVVRRLRSSIVLPMHWFSGFTLAAFIDGIGQEFTILRISDDYLDVSLRTLPSRPTVMIMQPQFLEEYE